jgi:hypothetical protein
MRAFLGLAIVWSLAAFLFYNSYYGIRYPDKYINASWTIMRGLPKERDSAAAGAAISMLAGGFCFLMGLAALYEILTQSSAPLPPLP